MGARISVTIIFTHQRRARLVRTARYFQKFPASTDQWDSSEKQGHVLLKSNAHESSGRALTDTGVETAIRSLERSTATIEKQCQLLEAQKRALEHIKTRHAGEGWSVGHDQQQRRATIEKAQLDFEVNELAESLKLQLKTSRKDVDGAVLSLPSSLERLLERDDRQLDWLHKVLPHITGADSNDDITEEVNRLCEALTCLNAQEVRLRIDTAFEQCTRFSGSSSNGEVDYAAASERLHKQRDSLRQELEELLKEIDGLATMAVDAQYRVPITRELKTSKVTSDMETARWSKYVAAALQHLTARLDALGAHADHLHAHQNAVKDVSAAFDAVLAFSTTTSKQDIQSAVQSPTTPIAKGLKPLRLVQANFSEPQDPTSQLLRHFEICGTEESDRPHLSRTLARTANERHESLTELSRNTERFISDLLAESIFKANSDSRDLLRAVYSYSQYSSLRIVDRDVEAGLADLEVRTQDLGARMRDMDFDDIAGVIKRKQKAILQR